MKRIAVIGSGIVAWRQRGCSAGVISSRCSKSDARLGGHTHTIEIDDEGGPLALDTGFLVHNRAPIPTWCGCSPNWAWRRATPTCRSRVTCPATGFEYSSRGAAPASSRSGATCCGPAHYRLLARHPALQPRRRRRLVAPGTETRGRSASISRHTASATQFVRALPLPMASAIWSTSFEGIAAFPAPTLVRFLQNHGMLSTRTRTRLAGRPRRQQRATSVGSRARCAGVSVRRPHTASVAGRRPPCPSPSPIVPPSSSTKWCSPRTATRSCRCWPTRALPNATCSRNFATTRNDIWLHTDRRLLPAARQARASWNYQLGGGSGRRAGRSPITSTVCSDLRSTDRLLRDARSATRDRRAP